MSVYHTWHLRSLSHAFNIPEEDIRLKLYTLGVYEVAPGRFPLEAHVLLKATSEGYPICRKCLRTGEQGPCPTRRCGGHIERLEA